MNSYQFLFGPRLLIRKNKVTPFVHALFGGVRNGIGSTTILGITTPAVSATSLGMGIGGGIDINLLTGLRCALPVRLDSGAHRGRFCRRCDCTWRLATNQIRIGIGLVVKAGE